MENTVVDGLAGPWIILEMEMTPLIGRAISITSGDAGPGESSRLARELRRFDFGRGCRFTHALHDGVSDLIGRAQQNGICMMNVLAGDAPALVAH